MYYITGEHCRYFENFLIKMCLEWSKIVFVKEENLFGHLSNYKNNPDTKETTQEILSRDLDQLEGSQKIF